MSPLILISGEGRSGTTMMVELFGKLGFDYGDHFEFLREVKLTPNVKFPEVIKHSGGFAVNLKSWIEKYNWKPAHLFYMVNDMETNIAKRLYPDEDLAKASGWGIKGTLMSHKTLGLSKSEFDELSQTDREELLRKTYFERLGKAAYGAIECGIPFTVVHYQRFCRDIEYACDVIGPLLRLQRFSTDEFRKVHAEHIKLERVRPWAK